MSDRKLTVFEAHILKLRKEYDRNPTPELAKTINDMQSSFNTYQNNKPYKPDLKVLKGGKKMAVGVPIIGSLLGLASGDVSAAVDPTGSTEMDYDRAIEDPSSKEFAKRRKLLDHLRINNPHLKDK
jgi:hypothetical protein